MSDYGPSPLLRVRKWIGVMLMLEEKYGPPPRNPPTTTAAGDPDSNYDGARIALAYILGPGNRLANILGRPLPF